MVCGCLLEGPGGPSLRKLFACVLPCVEQPKVRESNDQLFSRLSAYGQLAEVSVLYRCVCFPLMGLIMTSQRGGQDNAVGVVHISPSAESVWVDPVGHVHLCCLCCLCMSAYWKFLLSSSTGWTLGCRVVAVLPLWGYQIQQLLTLDISWEPWGK